MKYADLIIITKAYSNSQENCLTQKSRKITTIKITLIIASDETTENSVHIETNRKCNISQCPNSHL